VKPEIKIFAVEPKESAVLSGEAPNAHKIQGIGAGFIPSIYDSKVVDEIITVSSALAIETARKVATHEGLFVGISSGAVIAAAMEVILYFCVFLFDNMMFARLGNVQKILGKI
jgi:cysteine synthase A